MPNRTHEIPELTVHGVRSEEPWTLEMLRELRNATLGTYSRHNDHVTREAHAQWWNDGRNETPLGFPSLWALIWTAKAPMLDLVGVGYGVVRIIPPKILQSFTEIGAGGAESIPLRTETTAQFTIGVHPSYRRMGVGELIMTTLESTYAWPLIGVARLDNPAGMATHRESAGWRETHRDETYAYYRREGR